MRLIAALVSPQALNRCEGGLEHTEYFAQLLLGELINHKVFVIVIAFIIEGTVIAKGVIRDVWSVVVRQ